MDSGRARRHRGLVLDVTRGDSEVDPQLVPSYSDELNPWDQVGVWIKLSGLIDLPRDGPSQLIVQNSGAAVLDSLGKSVAGMFIVADRAGEELPISATEVVRWVVASWSLTRQIPAALGACHRSSSPAPLSPPTARRPVRSTAEAATI